MQASDLIAFEKEVAEAFESKKIKGPVHLSGGNEEQLIEIFKEIRRTDWVFCSYRYHYHALLHGVPRDELMKHLLGPDPMNFQSQKYRFYTSAIVGGQLAPAVGLAATGARVWCFLGDMAATTGAFLEAAAYARALGHPVEFVIEDNGLSCDTPTSAVWNGGSRSQSYRYKRTYPHVCTGKHVQF